MGTKIIVAFLFVFFWTRVHADGFYEGFETICVPNQACYYVSKFKANWNSAMGMCQAQIHSSSFNETDNVVLNQVPEDLLGKRYWVLELNDQDFGRKFDHVLIGKQDNKSVLLRKKRCVRRFCSKCRRRVNFGHFKRRPKTFHQRRLLRCKGGCRRKRIFKNRVKIGKSCRKKINWLKKNNWKNLIKYVVINKKGENVNRIKKIIDNIDRGDYKYINKQTMTWITNIIEMLKKAKRDRETIDNDNQTKNIIEISNKYIDTLNELNWEELIDKVGPNRDNINVKIKNFIKIVNENQFPNIDQTLLNEIQEIIRTLQVTKEKVIDKNIDERIETIKNMEISLPSNWKELLPNIEGIDSNLWIVRIEKLLSLVKEQKFKEINFDWMNELQNIITLITSESSKTETKTKVSEETITIIKKNIESIKQWNWDSYLEYIDENIRQQVQTDVGKIISICESNKMDELDEEFATWFIQIFESFQKINFAITNGYTFNRETKTWEKHTVETKESSRKKRCVRKFCKTCQKRVNFGHFTRHPTRFNVFRLFRCKGGCNQRRVWRPNIQVVNKFRSKIQWLLKNRWQHLIKYLVIDGKQENVRKINYIIKLIENNKFDNIDENSLKWINQIVLLLRRIKKNKKITDADDKSKVVIETSHKYVDFLNEINWPELIDKVEGIDKEEVKTKINTFITTVKNGDLSTIDEPTLNWLKEIVVKLKNTKEKVIEPQINDRVEIMKKIEIALPSNWKELLPNIEGIDVNLWIVRIETLLSMIKEQKFQDINFEWIGELQNIINLISAESSKTDTKTETKTKVKISAETLESVKKNVESIKQWNWEAYLQYIDENTRKQVQTDVVKMISIFDSNQTDQLDEEFIAWFTQIFQVFSKINFAITNGYTYNVETKTWEKTTVETKESSRRKRCASENHEKCSPKKRASPQYIPSDARQKRSLNTGEDELQSKFFLSLINQSMAVLQQAYVYMMSRQNKNVFNKYNFHYRQQMCPFIDKVDGKMVTRSTNCAIKQRFICKKQF